ncbi:AprI/Inh family metalloprotease inhibitor [Stenotrophomonas sp. P5_B8]
MRSALLFVFALVLAFPALAQVDNTGSINQSTQSESTSSTITTSSGMDSGAQTDISDESSPEMKAWIKSNETKSSDNKGFGVGFGPDNDDNADDQPRWSKHRPSRPKPEQMDGTYRINAANGPFLCTVRLTASPYFGGYFASTSTGCPDLWKVSRWDMQGPTIVLTNSSGDIYAALWPRDRDVWVGSVSATGDRISLSR